MAPCTQNSQHLHMYIVPGELKSCCGLATKQGSLTHSHTHTHTHTHTHAHTHTHTHVHTHTHTHTHTQLTRFQVILSGIHKRQCLYFLFICWWGAIVLEIGKQLCNDVVQPVRSPGIVTRGAVQANGDTPMMGEERRDRRRKRGGRKD